MRAFPLIAFAACLTVAAAGASAQSFVDVPISPSSPLPPVFEGPAFTSLGFTGGGPASLALFGGGAIHVWRGLPNTPVYGAYALSGSQAPVGRWYKLSATTASYRSVGLDLAPNTGDDDLMLVTNLPGTPTVVPVALTGTNADFVRINASTAVKADTFGFFVLRHDSVSGQISVFNVPSTLRLSTGFSYGRLDDDTCAAIGTGPDFVAGTTDDDLVLLTGLSGNAPLVQTQPLAAGTLAAGFAISESGVGVVWQPLTLPTMQLTTYRWSGGQVLPASLVCTPLATPGPGYAPTYGVKAGRGDTVIAFCSDDAGPGVGYRIVADLSTSFPTLPGPGWYDSANTGDGSMEVAEREIVNWSAAGPTWFTHTYYGAGTPVWFTYQMAWTNQLAFAKTHRGSLVAVSDGPATPMSLALATVFTGVDPGPPLPHSLNAQGVWGGGGVGSNGETWGPRLEPVGGFVAGFIAPNATSSPTILRMYSTPGAAIAAPGVSAGINPVLIGATPPATAAAPLRIDVTGPGNWSQIEGWMMVSWGLAQSPLVLGPPLFASSSLAQIDLANQVVTLPFNGTGNQATLNLNLTPVSQVLVGIQFYVQALVMNAGPPYFLTDALRLIVY